METQSDKKTEKKAYEAPKLTEFGNVRDLTLGVAAMTGADLTSAVITG